MNEPGDVDEVQGHFVRATTALSVVPTAGSLLPLGDWSLIVDVRDALAGRVDILDGHGLILASDDVVAGSASVGVGDATGTLTVRYVDGARVLTQEVTLPTG